MKSPFVSRETHEDEISKLVAKHAEELGAVRAEAKERYDALKKDYDTLLAHSNALALASMKEPVFEEPTPADEASWAPQIRDIRRVAEEAHRKLSKEGA